MNCKEHGRHLIQKILPVSEQTAEGRKGFSNWLPDVLAQLSCWQMSPWADNCPVFGAVTVQLLGGGDSDGGAQCKEEAVVQEKEVGIRASQVWTGDLRNKHHALRELDLLSSTSWGRALDLKILSSWHLVGVIVWNLPMWLNVEGTRISSLN